MILEEQLNKIIKIEKQYKELIKEIELKREQEHLIKDEIIELENKEQRLKLDVTNSWNKLKEIMNI